MNLRILLAFPLGLSLFFCSTSIGFAFSDVGSNHPNFNAIEYLEQQGAVEGYEDYTFRPDNSVNRAEFLKILFESTDMPLETKTNCFPDVQDQWFSSYVCSAKDQNILAGYPDRLFHPERSISFVEASKLLMNVYFSDLYSQEILRPKAFQVWYETYVHWMNTYKITPSSILNLDQLVTRADLAEMVWRMDKESVNQPARSFVLSEQDGSVVESRLWTGDGYSLSQDTVYFEQLTSPLMTQHPWSDGYPNMMLALIEDESTSLDPGSFVNLGDGYARDASGIYFYGGSGINGAIDEADLESFEVLEHRFARDKNRIYYYGFAFNDVDISSFEVVSSVYSKDDSSVYYNSPYYYSFASLQPLPNANPADFQIFPGHEDFGKDGNSVFFEDKVLTDFDADSFKILQDLFLNDVFVKDSEGVYFLSPYSPQHSEKVEDLDSATTISLGGSYLTDTNSLAYYSSNPESKGFHSLEGDAETFQVLGTPSETDDLRQYAKDKDSVYYAGKLIPGADSGSFEVLDNPYAQDKNAVYFMGVPLPESDPSTFTIMSSGYSKDSRHAYRNGEILDGADSGSFEVLDHSFTKDNSHVYYDGESIDADAPSFQAFGSFDSAFGKDAYRAYFVDFSDSVVRSFEPADLESFVGLGNGFAKDNVQAYFEDSSLAGSDAASFDILVTVEPYAIDKNSAYFSSKRIEGSDPDTFVVNLYDEKVASDQYGKYIWGDPLNNDL
ncbi:MAG: DKNYY domain-containing protein [Candidatus Gracilibacteria bacterium]|nr:DKNYY domain-containing protein [Candidatus Peregrinibacteria bacterium]